MTYTLYYSPSTASMAVHWTLIELGVPFQAVRLNFETNDQKSPTYLKLNPAGRVPTLLIDGVPYTESAALLMLLAERHPDAELAPAPGSPERARWLEIMIFMTNTVSSAMRDWFYADKDGDPAGAGAVRALARRRIQAAWPRLGALLDDGRPFLFGEAPGVADYMAAMLMRWSRNMDHPANEQAELVAYLARMRGLASYAELCRREEIAPWP